LKTFEDFGDTYYMGLVECMLAQCDRNEGHLDDAESRVVLGLSAYQEIENVMGIAWALYQLADIALQRAQPERSLRLVAVSDALLEQVGGEIPALVVATTGDVGEAARALLDGAVAKHVYEEGLAMSYDAAVRDVLQYRGEERPAEPTGTLPERRVATGDPPEGAEGGLVPGPDLPPRFSA
jgi:hypothetical protein